MKNSDAVSRHRPNSSRTQLDRPTSKLNSGGGDKETSTLLRESIRHLERSFGMQSFVCCFEINPLHELLRKCVSSAVVWMGVEDRGGEKAWTTKEIVMPRKRLTSRPDHVKWPSPPNTNCMKSEVVKAAFDQVPAGGGVRKTARALIANWPRHRILTAKLFFPSCFIWLTPLPASFSPPRLPTKALRWPALNPISNKTRRPASSPWCQRRYPARMRVARRLADWSVL